MRQIRIEWLVDLLTRQSVGPDLGLVPGSEGKDEICSLENIYNEIF